ncbi:hypothetical protein [Nostoc sp. TCL26-01]|uniref:hypothetical protein n=1 Tax=Nostoc sp. TCL26-01 TaxID=2576904 RepID=UPI0015BD3B3F|nr:hypothetical protein [Nostoc sp. TCL26-01]QLE55664.1 hypothetical protein FD725_09125 [Nostoc sp. TCL26-01]
MPLPPQTQSGRLVLESLTSLSKELKFYSEGFKASRKLKATIAEIDQIKRGVSTATSSVKTLEKQFGGAQKVVDVLNKDVKESKNLWNSFLNKAGGTANVAGAANAGGTIAKAGSALAKFAPILTALAAVGIAVAVNQIQGWRSDQNEKGLALLGNDVSKILGKLNAYQQRIENNNKAINDQKLDNQRTRDRVYGLEKQLVPIRDKANDALYEVRQGRSILESKISDARKYANDVLAESRGTASKINAQIQQQQTSINKQIADINAKIAAFTNGVKDNFQQNITSTVNSIKAELTSLKATQATKSDISAAIDKNNSIIDSKIKTNNDVLQNILKPVQQTVNTLQNGYTEITKNGVTTRYFDGVVKSLQDTYAKSFEAQAVKWNEDQRKLSDNFLNQLKQGNATSDLIKQGIKDVDKQVNDFIRDVERKTALIDTVKPDIDKLRKDIESDLNKDNNRLTTLETKIREMEKVNTEGNKKLDQILPKLDQIIPTLAGIPLIPGRVADTLKPSIPTLPQIENSVGTAMCKNLRTGCGKQAIDDAVGNVLGNSNNNTNALLNALNTGLNAGNLATSLALLPTINNKLGEQVPGGIGGKLSKLGKWLQFDRVFGMLTLAATIHNGVMLSNDIGTTLVGALTNVLTGLGLTDEDGAGIDVGKIIGASIEGFIQSLIGAANYNRLVDAWAKANRIYQATTNVLNSFLNLSQTILQASELIAAYTGRIGNALRKSGVILENAYGWMNPQPKFNRVTKFLEGLQTTASTVQMVTQVPLDVINATTEFTTASTDFVKAIKEDNKPENKSTPTPEPDELKAKETQSKTDSQPLNFDFSDLFDGED